MRVLRQAHRDEEDAPWPWEKAVIKTFQPCAAYGEQFGIVFDSDPPGKEPRFEDLFRPNRNDWKEIPWESDDLMETAELRPMCPKCGHPLGVGPAAWTFCIAKDAVHGKPCGEQEPGVMSHCQLTRGSKDIYANPAKAEGFYRENDSDSDSMESSDGAGAADPDFDPTAAQA